MFSKVGNRLKVGAFLTPYLFDLYSIFPDEEHDGAVFMSLNFVAVPWLAIFEFPWDLVVVVLVVLHDLLTLSVRLPVVVNDTVVVAVI